MPYLVAAGPPSSPRRITPPSSVSPPSTRTWPVERSSSPASVTAVSRAPPPVARNAPPSAHSIAHDVMKALPSAITRAVSILAALVAPMRLIVGLEPVAPITAVSAGPGRTSPAQFTGSRNRVPSPVGPPSQWMVASIRRDSRPSGGFIRCRPHSDVRRRRRRAKGPAASLHQRGRFDRRMASLRRMSAGVSAEDGPRAATRSPPLEPPVGAVVPTTPSGLRPSPADAAFPGGECNHDRRRPVRMCRGGRPPTAFRG